MSVTLSPRLAALPLPPRSSPIRRRKPARRASSGRLLCIDKETADKIVARHGALLPVSDMPQEIAVLVVGAGVPSFMVERVGAALKARGVQGSWLVEVNDRRRSPAAGRPVETLVGFPGLHIVRLDAAGNV